MDDDGRNEALAELAAIRATEALSALTTGIESVLTETLLRLADDPGNNWKAAKALTDGLNEVVMAARFGYRTDEGGDLPHYKNPSWEFLSGRMSGIESVMILAEPSYSYWLAQGDTERYFEK